MKAFIGITDGDCFEFLSARAGSLDEVNFWQPSGRRAFRALQPAGLFLLKLHAPRHYIVGGGFFGHFTILPLSLAWEAFGEKNGVASLEQMRGRIGLYRRTQLAPLEDCRIGCILLEQPFFPRETDWIEAPRDWGSQTVQGATYDLSQGEGKRVYRELTGRLPGPAAVPIREGETRYGPPTVVLPRLGQGSFRVIVMDIYERRCAVTGERTLPVLDAAHIKPFRLEGPHDPRNGLLLRSDLHTLFDRGYVTVTPELRLEVSRRIREEFENGRDYYAMQGMELRPPRPLRWAPSPEYLDWHASNVYRG